MSISVLWAYFLTCVLMAWLPGPDIYYVLSTSLVRGFRAGFSVALGLCAGCIFHTGLCASGISIIIANSPVLLNVVRVFGAIYLGYLAYASWKSRPEAGRTSGIGGGMSAYGLFCKGLIMNVSNPKVIIFFLSFFPQFLVDGGVAVWLQIFILGVIFMCSALAVFSFVAFFAGKMSNVLMSVRFAAIMRWVSICVFGGLALLLFVEMFAG